MSLTRVMIFIIITIYLVGLGFFIPSLAIALDKNVETTGIEKTIATDREFVLLPYPHVETTGEKFTLITAITDLPIWFNTIFLILPFVLWLFLIITFFVPTINAGS